MIHTSRLWILLLWTLVQRSAEHAIPPNDEFNRIPIPTASGELIWMPQEVVEAQQAIAAKWIFDESNIRFIFYGRKNFGGMAYNLDGLRFLNESIFNGSRPTRVVIHGWLNNADSPINWNLRDVYLYHWDYNVIVVDWSVCSLRFNYISVTSCVQLVGETVAKMLEYLQEHRALRLTDVYLIGHSLGGHVAGIAGKMVRGGKISTIVALDPALPLFSVAKPGNRVDAKDAEYVQVIHTNGGLLGFLDPIGSADFYPNGGKSQPGCGFNIAGICSHARAWELFVDSLWEPDEYLMAEPIGSLNDLPALGVNRIGRAKMGGEPSHTAYGLYYINTNNKTPFFGTLFRKNKL